MIVQNSGSPGGDICPSEGVRFKENIFPNVLTYKSYVETSVDFNISLSFFVIRNFKAACSSLGMMKGYVMVRERLGTSGPEGREKIITWKE